MPQIVFEHNAGLMKLEHFHCHCASEDHVLISRNFWGLAMYARPLRRPNDGPLLHPEAEMHADLMSSDESASAVQCEHPHAMCKFEQACVSMRIEWHRAGPWASAVDAAEVLKLEVA